MRSTILAATRGIILAIALLTSAHVAFAQPTRPSCPLAGCVYKGSVQFQDGGSWSASGILATGVNVTGTAGYELGGSAALNTLANTASPIYSPEPAKQAAIEFFLDPALGVGLRDNMVSHEREWSLRNHKYRSAYV